MPARAILGMPIPKRISNSDFDEICKSFKISPKRARDSLRAVVDGTVAGIAEFQTQQRSRPHLRDDRKRVKDAISAVEAVRRSLNGLGSDGKASLVLYECSLSGLISPAWLHHRFPDDPLAPKIAGLAPDFEHSLDHRQCRLFIQNRPALVTAAICEELCQVLNGTLFLLKNNPTTKGGRKRMFFRHNFICSLAEAWTFIGRRISTSPKSDFVGFVEAVVVSIGWSKRGIATAVAKAVKDWRRRNRAQKQVR